jgi:short-chain fatty acids transporter
MADAAAAAPATPGLQRLALRFTALAERWYPDAFVFAALAVLVVGLAALAIGAPPLAVSRAFGDGFWSLIPFTMQMAMVVIGGTVAATAPPVARAIEAAARLPRTGRGAVAFVAAAAMAASLLNWGFSLVFGGLLVRALARRRELGMDYRAAGAAAYLGLGATWALGLSSSAAQLQANPASLPKPILAITGVLPFSQTIFLPQSLILLGILFVVSVAIAWASAPAPAAAATAETLGIEETPPPASAATGLRPGDWLERSPLVTLILAVPACAWIAQEIAARGLLPAISNLNTYNLIFLTAGLLLHWRPASFLAAVARAVPATAGVLIQFPIYGAIAFMLTAAHGPGGSTVARLLAQAFVQATGTHGFPALMGLYSAVLGFFVPSGGGKWTIEAPYVMQAAVSLKVHLGWAVQVYNAAEALPNLINPFWMLPLLGVLGLRARDIVGFTFLQLVVHLPLVLFLLWALAFTLTYVPPVMP